MKKKIPILLIISILICAFLSTSALTFAGPEDYWFPNKKEVKKLKIETKKQNKKIKKYLIAKWTFNKTSKKYVDNKEPVYFNIHFTKNKTYSGKVHVKPSNGYFKKDVTKIIGNKKVDYSKVYFKKKKKYI